MLADAAAEMTALGVMVPLIANDFDVLRTAAIAGVGIAVMPATHCMSDIRDGKLEHVMPDYRSIDIPIHVVYTGGKRVPPKVKAFVDFLLTRMRPPPWEIR